MKTNHPMLPKLKDELLPVFQGRNVLVVGSAPGPDPVRRKDELLVTVNGSIGKVLFDKPDLHVILASRYESRPTRPANVDMIRQFEQRQIARIVYLTAQAFGASKTKAALHRLGCKVDRELYLLQREREQLVKSVRAPWGRIPPSTGFVAIILCVYLEAAGIRLSGFSWEQGYSYTARTEQPLRGHLAEDKAVLGNFLERWPNRFTGSLVENEVAA